jgi:hypothetical protein
MLSPSRREFLKSLTLAGAAVFTASHLKAIDLDLTSPKDPKVVVGPYKKTWSTLYAKCAEPDGYILSLTEPDDDFRGMTWREVFDNTNLDHVIEALEKLKELSLDGDVEELSNIICEDEASLKAFAAAGGEAKDSSEGPTWREVFELTDAELTNTLEEWCSSYPTRLAELDEVCDDWYDRVGPFSTPQGEAYLEVTELLETIGSDDSDLGDAARECFEIIEGAGPGSDYHGVHVKSREDLAVLRRLLHASGEKVNIVIC